MISVQVQTSLVAPLYVLATIKPCQSDMELRVRLRKNELLHVLVRPEGTMGHKWQNVSTASKHQ